MFKRLEKYSKYILFLLNMVHYLTLTWVKICLQNEGLALCPVTFTKNKITFCSYGLSSDCAVMALWTQFFIHFIWAETSLIVRQHILFPGTWSLNYLKRHKFTAVIQLSIFCGSQETFLFITFKEKWYS